VANYITLLRILLIIPVIYFISEEKNYFNWIALVLFVVAGLTDHLDGFIARKTGTTSSLGALLDLVADKLLISIVLIYILSTSDNEYLLIPSLVIVSRELIVTSLRQFLTETYGKNPIKVSFIAKSKTTMQIISLSLLIISPNLNDSAYLITAGLFWFTSFISIYSLYEYLRAYQKLIK
tara:strand:+ start:6742 stop:7278 length:537 start_codon:yes stop_codon:yes gene_type:complete